MIITSGHFTSGVTLIPRVIPPPTGLTSSDPSTSAWAIKQAYPSSTDGLYWIQNANINSGDPVQVYCDMTTLGGGWTLIMQNNYSDWTFNNALVRNSTTPPSTLATGIGSDGTANYSIISWADYIKRSASGFDYMLDARTRGRNGGAWTANDTYSFVDQIDLTAYGAQGSSYFGSDLVAGTTGFHQNITLLEKFVTSEANTWYYDDSGIEHRMPWFAEVPGTPGSSVVPNAIFTTTHDDSNSWWGTLMTTDGWLPAPWQNDTGNGYPGVIWYWVR